MKSILYVGATLMIGASIYGFVDYKKTSQKKEFSTMYGEEKKKAVVVIADNKTTEPVMKKEIKEIEKPVADIKVPEKNNAVKKVKKKKKLSANLFSRAPIREEEIEIKMLDKPAMKKTENKEQ